MIINKRTRSTMPAPISSWANIRILWREFVASFAVRLLGVKAPSAIDVYLRSHWLKMQRITAASGTAGMIQLQACRNRANQQLIAEAMDVNLLATNANLAIAAPSVAAIPEPTTGIRLQVNILLQALRQRRPFNRQHSTPVWPNGCAGVNFL
jgi:hypothetical protein